MPFSCPFIVKTSERRYFPMTANDKNVLLDGLTKLAEDAVSLAAFLKAITADNGEPDGAAQATAPAETRDEPAKAPTQSKVYTYEEARAILAEKSRLGHRAEVKSILTKHGVKQLSDVTHPKLLATLVAEAEMIQDE